MSTPLLHLRFYQNFLKIPGLSWLVNRLAMPYNLRVAHQDRGIVETEEPKRTSLKMGEKLIPADGSVIAYRRRWEELIAGNSRREKTAGLILEEQDTIIEAVSEKTRIANGG